MLVFSQNSLFMFSVIIFLIQFEWAINAPLIYIFKDGGCCRRFGVSLVDMTVV